MEPNTARAEAERWLGIAAKLLAARDLVGSKTFAIRAREADPNNPVYDQILAVVDTLIAAEKRVISSSHYDWYSILQLTHLVRDPELIVSQYRRLVLLLNPDHNRFPFSDFALSLVVDAWSVLSDPNKKWIYDSELSLFLQRSSAPAPEPVQVDSAATYQFFQQPQPQSQPQQWIHHLHQQEQQQPQLQERQLFQHQHHPQPQSQSQPQPPLPPQSPQQPQWLPHPQPSPQPPHQQPQLQERQLFQQQHHPQSQAQPQPPLPPQPPQQPQWLPQPQPPQQQPQLQERQLFQQQHDPQRPSHPQPPPNPQSPQQPQWLPQPQPQPHPHPQPQPQPQRQMPEKQQQPSQPKEPQIPPQLQRQQQQQQQQPPPPPPPQPVPTQRPPKQQQREKNNRSQEEGIGRASSVTNQTDTDDGNKNDSANNNDHDDGVQIESFWTACPYCYYLYEYPKTFQDCTLRCQNCRRGFHALQIPNPPLTTGRGKEGSFCSWGFFPLGFSMSSWKKSIPFGGDANGFASNWVPFSPMFVCPMQVLKKKVERKLDDNDEEFNVSGSSEDSDSDSSDDWNSTRLRKKQKSVRSGRSKVGRKSNAEKAKMANQHSVGSAGGADGENQHQLAEMQRNVNHGVGGTKNDVVNKAGSSGSLRKQGGKGVRGRKKLDLNVEFSNEVEDHATTVSAGNGEEEVEFFEGLDEFLSTLPILHVVGDDKAKPS